jgi:PAS domain S-box-containing protein
MLDSSSVLLQVISFIPHGHCYLWRLDLVGLHLLSDGLIAIAYYAISLTLLYFVYQRRDLPYPLIFGLFGAFIFACGTTHLIEIWTLWHPDYWASGIIKAFTAGVSVATAIVLIPLVPKALALPSPAQLEAVNQKLTLEILERRQAETSLRESEERFRRSFNDAAIGKALVSLEGFFLKVNQSLCEIVGYPADELQRLRFHDITFADDLDADLASVRQLLDGEIRTYQIEKRYIHKQGHLVWVLLSGSLMRSDTGHPLYFIAQVQDISDRKQVEQALQHSEFQNRALLKLIPDLLIRVRRDGVQLEFINHGNVRPLTQHHRQVNSSVYDVLPPDLACQRMRYVHRALDNGEPQTYEYSIEIGGETHIEEARVVPYSQDEVLFIVRDISDRKQAEESLRQYERVVSATNDAISLVDRHYVYRLVNHAYLNWNNKHYDEIVGHSVSHLLGDEVFTTLVKPKLDQCLAGETIEYQDWFTYANLGRQFVSVTYSPYYDAQQQIEGVVASTRNITSRKLVEDSLRQSQEILQTIFDHIPIMIAFFDMHGHVQFINRELEQTLGWSLNDWQQQGVLHLCYPDPSYRKEVMEHMFAATGRWKDITISTASGATLETAWANVRLSNGNHIGIGQDISERKLAEQKLKESEERFRAIFNQTFQFVGLLTPEGILLEANQTALDFAGVSREQVINRPFWEARWWTIAPATQVKLQESIQAAAEGTFIRYEVEVLGEGDRTAIIDFSLRPIFDEHGEVTLLIPEGRDISDHVRARAQIEASLKEKEVLLKEVHHRVKNNLQIVDSLLKMQSRRADSPQVIAALTESQNRITSIALVHEELYQSKNLSEINAADYIPKLARSIFSSYITPGQSIHLRTDIYPTALDVDTAVPFGLILSELISNALKYAFPDRPSGEIWIKLAEAAPDSTASATPTLTLTVSDNGIGLPDNFEGLKVSSLGLKLVHSLVTQLNGRVIIERLGGTLFHITFPYSLSCKTFPV